MRRKEREWKHECSGGGVIVVVEGFRSKFMDVKTFRKMQKIIKDFHFVE